MAYLKVSTPRGLAESSDDTKFSSSESPKPASIGSVGERHQKVIRMDIPSADPTTPEMNSKVTGSNSTGNHGTEVVGTMFRPASLSTGKTEKESSIEISPSKITSSAPEPFFVMASMPGLKKPESREAYPKHPYSIQLGSF